MTDSTANTATASHTIRRMHSTQTEHLREDLAAALDLIMELADAMPEDRIAAAAIVVDLYHPNDERAKEIASWLSPQAALRRVREAFGTKAFGIVALFSIEAKTSLAGDCESLTSKQALASMNMTMRDLGWPQDRLHPAYSSAGQPWSRYERDTFSAAVEDWKQAHPDPVATTTHTVIGYWSGDEVVITGIVDGEHPVWGGTDETGDGLFADSFAIPADAPDTEAALREAIAAQYYDRENETGV